MASPVVPGRRYLVEELLGLRASVSTLGSVLEKLRNHPEISSASRIAQAGTMNHRTPFSSSKSLSEITNRQQTRSDARKDITDSSDESELHHIVDQNADRDHRHVHWNFRRRDSSDQSSQPHSAPTGIAAQQSENFQRFYRAVVSPTHVRVTAGGRIVPNNRAVAPPLFDWNGDKFHFEPKNTTTESGLRPPLPQSPWPLSAPFPTGYPSLMPGGFLPAFNFLHKNVSISPPTMASQVQHGFVNDLATTERSQIPHVNGDISANTPQGALPQSVKISHPSQFDHTKPFTFNGQVVYPLPPGFQPPQSAIPLPIGMLPPNMMTQASMVPQTSPFLPAGFSVLPNPFMFPMMMPNPASETTAPVASLMPMGIAPVSELLSAQIQFLRTQVKSIEDMITAHSNPMGENIMVQQKVMLLSHITTLEAFLQTQVSQEELAKKATSTDKQPTNLQNSIIVPETLSSKKESVAEKQAVKNDQSSNKAPSISQQTSKPDQGTRSRLTLAAAMAPPFKPRAKSAITNGNATIATPVISQEPESSQSPETDEQVEARLLSKSDTDWGQPSIFGNNEISFTFPRSQTFHEGSTEARIGSAAPSYQRSHTYNGTASGATPSVVSAIANQSAPYLIGTLPRGIPATMVKPDDIAYSRPLTADEVRARYLYWGKAPRSVQSGLPKFDGKDFYPPSPVKEHVQTLQSSQHTSTLIDPNGTPAPIDFSKLFEGYKTPSPVHRLHLQNIRPLMPIPQPIFEKAKSPVPETSSRNGSVKSGWSATYAESHERAFEPCTPPPAIVQSNSQSNPGSDEDFSHLFITKSPSPPHPQTASPKGLHDGYLPNTTSKLKLRFENANDDEIGTQNSWSQPSYSNNRTVIQTKESPTNDGRSSDSTVEIQLSPRVKSQTFAERVENFRTPDQQTLFLQNMLRAQPPMATTALSGAITSATAQGFLPQYRGSAAASLAPAMYGVPVASNGGESSFSKATVGKAVMSSVSPLVVSSTFSENHPLNRERSLNSLGSDGLGAEEYMRYLTKKEDNKKKISEQGWGSGAGPDSNDSRW